MSNDDDDPFAVFDDDDPTTPLERDAVNGPMSHHVGIEQALWQYVQQKVVVDAESNQTKKAMAVLQAVDEFCFQRHWMMHVGVREEWT